jgi:TRAP-type mannitol/chloroaromatic compound transport system permease large subunit
MSAMLMGEILSIALLAGAICALLLGYPIAFTLPGIAIIFAIAGWALSAFDPTFFNALPLRYWGIVSNEVLIAVPLFVLMGVTLERSRIAEDLLTTMGALFGKLRGGLGLSTVLVATLLAASTGIVGATVVTMGLISLPAMLKAGYDKRMASGLICAAGTLGQIVPPSTVLVFLAVILQSAYSQAQMAKGNFQPDTLSVGDMFAGAFIPGLILATLYALWIALNAWMRPSSAPELSISKEEKDGLAIKVVVALAPPLLLIISVLGSIIAGIATPTESASVGAVGAIVLALIKAISDHYFERLPPATVQRALLYLWSSVIILLAILGLLAGGVGVLTLCTLALIGSSIWVALTPELAREVGKRMHGVAESGLVITSMVFVIFFGASVFSMVFTRLGGEFLVTDFLTSLPGGVSGAMAVVMLIMFLLGFFLDPFEIIFVVVPIAGPVLLNMGVDPIWLSILIGINLQTSYLTPPFGFSLFFLRGVAPPEVTTRDIYLGILPYVSIQVACMALVWSFPALATWLPKVIYGGAP